MSMLLKSTLAAVLLTVLVNAAHAETAVPDRLIIGYDHEGKIDASPQACLQYVKEITEWDKAATEKGAREVCAARKRHVDAYAALASEASGQRRDSKVRAPDTRPEPGSSARAALQAAYKDFVKTYSVDRRLNLPGVVASFQALVKACMEHKFGLTTGGHNIRIDIIENDCFARVDRANQSRQASAVGSDDRHADGGVAGYSNSWRFLARL